LLVAGVIMRRRDVLSLLGGVAVAARPLPGFAQSAKVPLVGVLMTQSSGSAGFWTGFREDLRALGYIENKNIRFEYRSDEGDASRLPALAAELVRLKPDLIVTWFTPAGFAAKQATRDIPIVMGNVGNPVETGLIASLARPGGNITGIAGIGAELAGKCVDLLREMLPATHRIVALANAPDPFSKPFVDKIKQAGQVTRIAIDPMLLRGPDELETAFAALAKDRPDAVIVQPTLGAKRPAELALQHRIPAVSFIQEFAQQGGLMSYAVAYADVYRKAAIFVDKILKGAKPAELPAEEPSKFELVINLKTAKAVGLDIPPTFLERADKVIE
jgi:putative ABC transport system substrate-binding protein